MFRTNPRGSILKILGLGVAGGILLSIAGFFGIAGRSGVAEIEPVSIEAGQEWLKRYWPGYHAGILKQSHDAGVREAKHDLRTGVRRILTYGSPYRSWEAQGGQAFLDRGYVLHSVGTCIVTEETHQFVEGHNSVAVPEFNQRFGDGAFEAIMIAARDGRLESEN